MSTGERFFSFVATDAKKFSRRNPRSMINFNAQNLAQCQLVSDLDHFQKL
jgi:hypothetical protein